MSIFNSNAAHGSLYQLRSDATVLDIQCEAETLLSQARAMADVIAVINENECTPGSVNRLAWTLSLTLETIEYLNEAAANLERTERENKKNLLKSA